MNARDNSQVIQSMFAAFGKGDIPAVFSHLNPEVTWNSAYAEGVPLHGVWRGLEGVQQLFSRFGGLDIKAFVAEEFITQGDKVVVLGHERVGVKSTGKEYFNRWAHVYTVKDGKVTAVNSYNDTAAVLRAYTA